jgi:hypothetical protein
MVSVLKQDKSESYTKCTYKIVHLFYMFTFVNADAYKQIELGDNVEIGLYFLCNRY